VQDPSALPQDDVGGVDKILWLRLRMTGWVAVQDPSALPQEDGAFVILSGAKNPWRTNPGKTRSMAQPIARSFGFASG